MKPTPTHAMRSKLAASIALATIIHSGLATPVFASESLMLEEVIVTAQKRNESLQDVPISVSAVGAEQLASAGIENIADIVAYIPNIHTTQSGLTTELRIRGVGSGNNGGFEQSVGQYIDGIYYGRAQLIRAPFLDLERVEVLRGPQGILFGKNSIAGALNMTTAKPTAQLEGAVTIGYETEFNGKEINAYVSGPITDTLSARLAYRGYEDDGYVENTFRNEDGPQKDEDALRLTVAWEPSDDLQVTVKAEKDTFDTTGRQIEMIEDKEPSISASPAFAGRTYNEILTNILGRPGFEDNFDFKRQADAAEFSESEIYNYTVTVNYALNENTLTLISGATGYEFDELCDCDFTATNFFVVPTSEEYDQFSQEIRLTSPGAETIDWITGIFYQKTEFETESSLIWPADSASGTFRNSQNYRLNEQESESWAVFAQATWNATDALRVTLGARYTSEDKDAERLTELRKSDTGIALDPVNVPADAAQTNAWFSSLNIVNHQLKGDRSETAFTPTVNVQYDLNPDTMLYASASKGFKAGGFDSRANNPTSFEFENEEVISYEIGSKSTLADGAAELNIAYFYTDYSDLQTSQFDGKVGFTVGNAERLVTQGLEVDGRWLLLEGLTMRYALSYMDTEYKDFDTGNCPFKHTPDGQTITITVDTFSGPQTVTANLCDYAGQSTPYSPKKTANIGFDHAIPLTDEIDLLTTIDLQYVDNQDVHVSSDPKWNIDDYTTVNMRIGLDADSWSVAVLGKNLTDEKILTYAGNAPLTTSTFKTNTFYGLSKPPRTITLEASYRF